MNTIVTHYYLGSQGPIAWRTGGGSRAGRVEGSGDLGGRNRAVRSRRRPGRQGSGRPKWIVCRRPAPSPGARNRGPAGRTSRRRHGPPRPCCAARGRPPGRWPPWRSASQVCSMLPRRRSRNSLKAQHGPCTARRRQFRAVRTPTRSPAPRGLSREMSMPVSMSRLRPLPSRIPIWVRTRCRAARGNTFAPVFRRRGVRAYGTTFRTITRSTPRSSTTRQ